VLKRLNELRGDAGAASTATPAAAVAPPRPAPAPSAAPTAPRPAPKPAAQTPVAPVAQVAPAAPSVAPAVQSEIDLQALWPNLIDAIGRASPFARSYFLEAHPVSFARGVFTIGFDPEFADHIGMVDNAKNHALISTKLSELGIPGAQVKIIKAERPDHFAAPAAPVAEPPKPPVPTPGSTATAPAKQTAATSPKPVAEAKPIQMDPSEFKNDPLIKKALEIFKGTIVEVRA